MSDALPALAFLIFLLTFLLFAKHTKLFRFFFFFDDADSDEGKEDGGDRGEFDVGHDRAFDLGAGDEISGKVDQDDVSAVEVANMCGWLLKSARRQCALCIRLVSVRVF